MPKPVQAGGIPIWVSGTINHRTVRRLARFGSGWIPWGPDAADLTSIVRMKEALAAAGRQADDLQVVGYLPTSLGSDGGIDLGATMDRVGPMVEAGVTDFRTTGQAFPEGPREDRLHALVVAFRSAVGRALPS